MPTLNSATNAEKNNNTTKNAILGTKPSIAFLISLINTYVIN